MLKAWLKFVLWTTVIGVILRFVITRITGQPFFGLLATIQGGIEYLLVIVQLIVAGIVLGTIIFGIWYIVAGRRKPQAPDKK